MNIRWRPILFVGLVWAMVILGPAGCEMIVRPCKPLIVATCE